MTLLVSCHPFPFQGPMTLEAMALLFRCWIRAIYDDVLTFLPSTARAPFWSA